MKNDLVSIIIPTYKSWELLEKCLCAIDEQIYIGDYEVLVVNNDTDPQHPIEILNHKNLRILQELKPGSYAARNKGIAESKGQILVFTDADCIPDKDWLKNGVSKLIETNAGIVAGDVKLFYKNPEKLSAAEVYDKYTAFRIKEYVGFGNCVTANWFSYKQTMINFGCFDESIKSGGDTKLSQLISSKKELLFGENVIVYHPARFNKKEIITKHRRFIGGRFINTYQNKKSNFSFLKYIIIFIFKKSKFNLNFLMKGKIKDFFKIAYVHFFLFPILIKEGIDLINNKTPERN